MLLDTLLVMFRRLTHREPKRRLNIEQALRNMYRKGVATGKLQATTIYGPYCATHDTRLEQSEQVGVYICPLCQLQQQAEAMERAKHWQPEIERHTSGIHAVVFPRKPGMLSAREVHQLYVEEQPTIELEVPTELQLLLRQQQKQ